MSPPPSVAGRASASFQLIGRRDFRLYWASLALSVLGRSMSFGGQAWVAFELTHSPLKVAVIGSIQFMPSLLFSLFAGTLVDRLPKRRLLAVNNVAAGGVSLGVAALLLGGRLTYEHLLVSALVLGVIQTLDWPARQAFMAEVTGPVHLANGIAMNSATQNATRIVGPSLIAVLGGPFGMGVVFLVNGACLLAAAGMLLPVKARGLGLQRPRASMLAEVREGVMYSLRAPTIFLTLSLLAAISTFVFNFQIFVPTLVRQVLGEGTETYGLLMAALGVGSLAGSLGLALLARQRPPVTLLIGSALAVSALTAGLSATDQLLPAVMLLGAIGIMQALFQSSSLTMVQLAAPPVLTGRVLSLYSLLLLGVTPIGYSFTGVVTEHLGVAGGLLVGGIVSLGLCIAATAWWWLGHAGHRPSTEADRLPPASLVTSDVDEVRAVPSGVEQRA